MIVKNGSRSRNASRNKLAKKETEIVDNNASSNPKKAKTTEKKKDSTDNISSESTLLTLKNIRNEKDKEVNHVEIMNIEVPESIPKTEIKIEKKVAGKKHKNDQANLNQNKNDKAKRSVKLSYISGRSIRSRKIESITLEETDSDDIQITSEIKVKKPIRKREANSNKKSKGKIKKVKKEDKKQKVKQNKKSLLTAEKENISISKISGRNVDLTNGFNSSSKVSKKSKGDSSNEDFTKPKSTIKANYDLNKKNEKFLGRKKKAENRSTTQSITPVKKQKEKIANQKEKSKNQKGHNNNTDNYVTTPTNAHKAVSKKKNNLRIPKMEEENSKKKISSPSLTVLNQLFIEYGYEHVIDTLCKSKLEEKYKLDSCLKGLKNSTSKEKLPFLLIKILFSYFGSQIEEIKKECLKRSISAKKVATSNIEEPEKKPKNSASKSPENISNPPNVLSNSTIEVDESEIDKMENKNVSGVIKAPNQVKEAQTQIQDKVNVSIEFKKSIGSHYNKTKDGEIYKYQVSALDEKGNAIFKCYDEKCSGMGIYDVDSKKFSITQNHSIIYGEHDYIDLMNKDECDGDVLKDLKEEKYSDAQIFKENGKRIIKMS